MACFSLNRHCKHVSVYLATSSIWKGRPLDTPFKSTHLWFSLCLFFFFATQPTQALSPFFSAFSLLLVLLFPSTAFVATQQFISGCSTSENLNRIAPRQQRWLEGAIFCLHCFLVGRMKCKPKPQHLLIHCEQKTCGLHWKQGHLMPAF